METMLTSAISAAFLGFLLGLRHATDADHVVAVTTIVARERSLARAARVGALWGVGHTVTVLLVGGAMIAFRVVIPPRVGLALEFGVALMLILLGFLNLRTPADKSEELPSPSRALIIGSVHGLAGSAAVALLVLATIRSTPTALAYLAIFGLGTIVGMMLVTTLLAAPALWAGAKVQRAQHGIRLAAGAASLIIGVLLARELIVDGGLFAEVPTWDPR